MLQFFIGIAILKRGCVHAPSPAPDRRFVIPAKVNGCRITFTNYANVVLNLNGGRRLSQAARSQKTLPKRCAMICRPRFLRPSAYAKPAHFCVRRSTVETLPMNCGSVDFRIRGNDDFQDGHQTRWQMSPDVARYALRMLRLPPTRPQGGGTVWRRRPTC